MIFVLAFAHGVVLVGMDEFDLIIEIGGVGGVENGDGAAALFVWGLGLLEGIDERAQGVEAGVGEFG